ncbi:hypothetical protein IFM47457_11442 [Aspergillus lentulus]|nr:hypothetical protein IFM47457_11442 [Aspergillus lentulus]
MIDNTCGIVKESSWVLQSGIENSSPEKDAKSKEPRALPRIVAEVCQTSILRIMDRGETSKTSEQWTWVARATVNRGYRIEN